MEHGSPQAKVAHMATGLVREGQDVKTSSRQLSHELGDLQADNEILLPVSVDLAITNNCGSKIADHGGTCITCSPNDLNTMPDGPAALSNLIFKNAIFTMSIVIEMGGPFNGGSFDRCSGSQSNLTLRSLS